MSGKYSKPHYSLLWLVGRLNTANWHLTTNNVITLTWQKVFLMFVFPSWLVVVVVALLRVVNKCDLGWMVECKNEWLLDSVCMCVCVLFMNECLNSLPSFLSCLLKYLWPKRHINVCRITHTSLHPIAMSYLLTH